MPYQDVDAFLYPLDVKATLYPPATGDQYGDRTDWVMAVTCTLRVRVGHKTWKTNSRSRQALGSEVPTVEGAKVAVHTGVMDCQSRLVDQTGENVEVVSSGSWLVDLRRMPSAR